MLTRKHIIIHGLVQGVFFRANTQDTALALNLNGWVTNRFDGNVEAVFEGESSAVDQMITWCHSGPPSAQVDRVEIFTETYTGHEPKFYIKY